MLPDTNVNGLFLQLKQAVANGSRLHFAASVLEAGGFRVVRYLTEERHD